ncbi:hypothetical protein KVR01_001028 [Diaporthe batatas]|uniref:uncharacterized protein n=1 Tax=Diaporthe batatas TaxID=748121 RepID=UPI001D041783|nr:uncharacterized protein KVR01_001028 [Diaporthe batatas]KAG8170283.1 hypothetical protein KVR01_001028 [Diaporthe batatas]
MMLFGKQNSWSLDFHTVLLFFTLLLNVAAQAPVLGVTIDKSARDDAQRIIYSTKLTFNEDTGTLFSDAQIYGLARLGFEEMRTKYAADEVRDFEQPVMMAAMAVGKSVYISSNIKGGPYFYAYTDTHLKPEVTLALERCTTSLEQNRGVPVSGQHRTKASCAEIAALHEFYLDPDVSDADREKRPATRMAAFGQPGGVGKMQPQAACGGPENVVDGFMTWGCKQFMTEESINVPKKPSRTSADMNLPNPFPEFTSKQVSFVCPGRSGGRRLGEDPPSDTPTPPTETINITLDPTPTSTVIINNRF